MENNQFTKIGTFCEKCREVMCRCYEYEQNLKEMDKKLNGFNNGRDTTDGVVGKDWIPFMEKHTTTGMRNLENKGLEFKTMEENKTLRNKVFEALGEVSMCWSETPKGVFDSTNAERIGNELMKEIDSEIEVYRKIAYEVAKSQTGKVLMMDINMVPENMDVKEFLKTWKQQQSIQLVQSKPNLQEAIEVLCNALREDTTEGSYYYSWMCNIKMSFIDSWDNWGAEEYKSNVDDKIVNEIAETAAKNFLNLLIK